MSTETNESADEPAAQTETDVDIDGEHRQAQQSGEVFDGEHPNSR